MQACSKLSPWNYITRSTTPSQFFSRPLNIIIIANMKRPRYKVMTKTTIFWGGGVCRQLLWNKVRDLLFISFQYSKSFFRRLPPFLICPPVFCLVSNPCETTESINQVRYSSICVAECPSLLTPIFHLLIIPRIIIKLKFWSLLYLIRHSVSIVKKSLRVQQPNFLYWLWSQYRVG